jgi:hypothetical protein
MWIRRINKRILFYTATSCLGILEFVTMIFFLFEKYLRKNNMYEAAPYKNVLILVCFLRKLNTYNNANK